MKWSWVFENCGCCGGLRWGTETPMECNRCKGNGYYMVHILTGMLSVYPGGPFLGKLTEGDRLQFIVELLMRENERNRRRIFYKLSLKDKLHFINCRLLGRT